MVLWPDVMQNWEKG